MKHYIKDKKKIKIRITIVAAIMLLFTYIVIFFFSSSDGDASGELSRRVTGAIISFVERVIGIDLSWNNSETVVIVDAVESPIRKLAHVIEYTAVGFLSYSIILCWRKNRKRSVVLGIIIVVVSAAADEYHQYFVPGRFGSPIDVAIDTIGGIIGMAIVYMVYKIFRKKIV